MGLITWPTRMWCSSRGRPPAGVRRRQPYYRHPDGRAGTGTSVLAGLQGVRLRAGRFITKAKPHRRPTGTIRPSKIVQTNQRTQSSAGSEKSHQITALAGWMVSLIRASEKAQAANPSRFFLHTSSPNPTLTSCASFSWVVHSHRPGCTTSLHVPPFSSATRGREGRRDACGRSAPSTDYVAPLQGS
jgi:hypothetical protein